MMVPWITATLIVLPAGGAVCPHSAAVPLRVGATGPALKALYTQGKTYVEFRDAAQKRVASWHEHYARAQVPDALLTRTKATSGTWRLLVVAEDRCGDSVNTIPYVARLVDLVPNLDMRIIDARGGQAIMQRHRTPDGRPATPTIVLLDERFDEAGCWVERPAKLQTWVLEHEAKLDANDLHERKYAWYDDDQGRETLREVVEMLEAARSGTPICAG